MLKLVPMSESQSAPESVWDEMKRNARVYNAKQRRELVRLATVDGEANPFQVAADSDPEFFACYDDNVRNGY